MLTLAKVVGVHPDDNSADIVFLDTGARAAGVPIMAGAGMTSRSGTVDTPAPTVGGNKWDPVDSKDADITAVVGWIKKQPIITGFLFPQVSQMLFADANRRITRHISDVYFTIDKDGNTELFHPSGAFVRFGVTPAHEDLTAKDFDKKWAITKNTDKAVHIHVEQAGGAASLDIAPGGAIVVNTAATVTVTAAGTVHVTAGGAATVTAPSVLIDSPTSHATGSLTVDGLITGKGGMAISGGSGATVAGNMAITGGNVTADSIGLKTHDHVDPQGGTVGLPVG